MNAFCPANLMRGRPIAAVCTDENRRIDFAAKILEESRKQNNCARHIMRELAEQQFGFPAIDEHQFRKREVRRQADRVRVLPTADFIKETWQVVRSPGRVAFGFAWSQQCAVFPRQIQAVNWAKFLDTHRDFRAIPVNER